MRHFNDTHGLTLIELLIAIGVFGIILSFGFFNTTLFITQTKKDQLSEEIVSTLREAREKTLAREDGFAYGVHLEAGSFTLFRAPTYNLNAGGNDVHIVPNDFEITSIALQSGGVDVLFNLFSGDTNTSGSFTVEHEEDEVSSSTINIYETGIVEIE